MVEYIPTPLDATLGALADPTRRALLTHLREGETRVTDLAAPFDISLNAVSKHVKVLESAGLIHRRKEGRSHYISVDPRPLSAAADWFTTQTEFWNTRLDALEEALREDDLKGEQTHG